MRFFFKDFEAAGDLERESFWFTCFVDVFGVERFSSKGNSLVGFLTFFQEELTKYIRSNMENSEAYVEIAWPHDHEEREAVQKIAEEFMDQNVLFQDEVVQRFGPPGLMMIPSKFWSPCICERYRYLVDLQEAGML